MLYIHSYAIFLDKSGNFIYILDFFGVGLAFFWCWYWPERTGVALALALPPQSTTAHTDLRSDF
jgi:hypothetical protein